MTAFENAVEQAKEWHKTRVIQEVSLFMSLSLHRIHIYTCIYTVRDPRSPGGVSLYIHVMILYQIIYALVEQAKGWQEQRLVEKDTWEEEDTCEEEDSCEEEDACTSKGMARATRKRGGVRPYTYCYSIIIYITLHIYYAASGFCGLWILSYVTNDFFVNNNLLLGDYNFWVKKFFLNPKH